MWGIMNLKAYKTAMGTCWLLREGQVTVARFGPCSKMEAVGLLKKAERARSMDEVSKLLGIARDVTVSEWVEIYRERYLSHKAPATQRAEERLLKRVVALHGQRFLSAVTKGDLEDYKARRAKERHPRSGGPLSPWTVNADLRILKVIFSHAVDDGYLAVSPASRAFKLLRQDRAVIPQLGWEPVASLIKEAGRLHRIAILVVVKCGLRPGEALRLRVEDVREAGEFLRVRSTPERPTKARAERLVPLPLDARTWLEWLATWWVNPRTGAIGRRDPLKQPFLFCHADGRSIKSMKKALLGAQTRAGVGKLSFKLMRKLYASALAASNVHPEKVRLATGHADVQVLLQHYTVVDLEDVGRVVRSWPAIMEMPESLE